MDAKKLADAFEGIDDKYKLEADLFSDAAKHRRKKSLVAGILKGAVGVAAAVALVAGLLWIGRMQRVPVNTNARASGDVKDTGLIFMDSEEKVAASDIAMPEGGWAADLTPEQIASIWGQDELTWMGLNVSEKYTFAGSAMYDAQGNPQQVWLSVTDQWQHMDGPGYLIEIELAPERMPVSCYAGDNEPLSPTCTVYDTRVDARAPTDENGNVQYFAARFLKGGSEPIGLRARIQVENMDMKEETARDLMNRLITQCLRPGNTFTLAGVKAEKAEASPAPAQEVIPGSVSMEEAAVQIAADLVEEWLHGMSGQNPDEIQECFFQNLKITHIRKDEQSFVFGIRLVFKPTDATMGNGWWWAGNTKEGTGENEGYLTASRSVLVNKIDDQWQFADWGTNYGGWGDAFTELEEPVLLSNEVTPSQVLSLAEKASAGNMLNAEDFADYAHWAAPENCPLPIHDAEPTQTLAYPVPGGFTLYAEFGDGGVTATALTSPYSSGCTLADGTEAVAKVLVGEDPFPNAALAPADGTGR